jgi:hypothetical protein
MNHTTRHSIPLPETDAGRAAYFAALEAADRRDFQPLVDLWRDRLAHAETPEA